MLEQTVIYTASLVLDVLRHAVMDPSKKPKKSALKGGAARADDSAEGSFQAGKGAMSVQEQLQANFEIKVSAWGSMSRGYTLCQSDA